MKILLTGGSGFIGKYLKESLSKNHDIVSPSSSVLNLADYSCVTTFFKDQYFDAVIHAAGKGRENVLEDNADITFNILTSFFNLFSCQSHYGMFINFGSGAEFGMDKDISNAKEDDIFKSSLIGSYGIAKNYVARVISENQKFYNLRIFSCIDPSESDQRLVQKFNKQFREGKTFVIENDRYVDFVSLEDVSTVVEAVLDRKIVDRDLNVVYKEKLLVSETLAKYCRIKDIDTRNIIVTGTGKSYTGNGNRLDKYNLCLVGVLPSFERYR